MAGSAGSCITCVSSFCLDYFYFLCSFHPPNLKGDVFFKHSHSLFYTGTEILRKVMTYTTMQKPLKKRSCVKSRRRLANPPPTSFTLINETICQPMWGRGSPEGEWDGLYMNKILPIYPGLWSEEIMENGLGICDNILLKVLHILVPVSKPMDSGIPLLAMQNQDLFGSTRELLDCSGHSPETMFSNGFC